MSDLFTKTDPEKLIRSAKELFGALEEFGVDDRAHYEYRFKKFITGWRHRGYLTIPEEAPPELEAKCWAPSWRRMCKVLLRNDWWCKGLGQTQPKSAAYERYKQIKKARKVLEVSA